MYERHKVNDCNNNNTTTTDVLHAAPQTEQKNVIYVIKCQSLLVLTGNVFSSVHVYEITSHIQFKLVGLNYQYFTPLESVLSNFLCTI